MAGRRGRGPAVSLDQRRGWPQAPWSPSAGPAPPEPRGHTETQHYPELVAWEEPRPRRPVVCRMTE
eukprot:1885326-Alexandrium_andersonii.AAC.1